MYEQILYSYWGNSSVIGTWTKIDKILYFSCPQCKRVSSIVDHRIDVFGNVIPSIVCGHKCGYDKNVRLVSYNVAIEEE